MEFYRKERLRNGWRNIYIFGLKVYSYKNKPKVRKLSRYCDIPRLKELLRKGTIFPHPVGVVVAGNATIGNNCVIFQNVTIGTNLFGKETSEIGFPNIGNNVTICSGAVVIGGVKIGDNSIIGANAVVIKDVPPNTMCYGVPAKNYPMTERQLKMIERD